MKLNTALELAMPAKLKYRIIIVKGRHYGREKKAANSPGRDPDEEIPRANGY
jgi:hypothetical protein